LQFVKPKEIGIEIPDMPSMLLPIRPGRPACPVDALDESGGTIFSAGLRGGRSGKAMVDHDDDGKWQCGQD
jgi:hypothetical protein